jgi:hypothetical protein
VRPRDIPPLPPNSYDDLDTRIEYAGSWMHDRQFQQASGGSITYSNQRGDVLRLFFEGTSITYVYTKTFNRGIVEVVIDRKFRGRINLYSKETQWQQQTTFSGLEPGPHTLELKVGSRKDPQSRDYYVDLDRFVIQP